METIIKRNGWKKYAVQYLNIDERIKYLEFNARHLAGAESRCMRECPSNATMIILYDRYKRAMSYKKRTDEKEEWGHKFLVVRETIKDIINSLEDDE